MVICFDDLWLLMEIVENYIDNLYVYLPACEAINKLIQNLHNSSPWLGTKRFLHSNS